MHGVCYLANRISHQNVNLSCNSELLDFNIFDCLSVLLCPYLSITSMDSVSFFMVDSIFFVQSVRNGINIFLRRLSKRFNNPMNVKPSHHGTYILDAVTTN